MVIIRPDDTGRPQVREFDRAVQLEELQAAVGGYIELVPGFATIGYGGVVMNCAAFCNEDGKLDHLPINESATDAWERALVRLGGTLRDETGRPLDVLVGPIAVLFGDREFMSKL